jgi:hypothetical protein
MYDVLLFAHVLAAFLLVAMVVMYSAFAMGGPTPKPAVTLAQILDGVGGIGTLIFGVWLALYVDGYQIWDGWIIAALILWAAAAEAGRRTHESMKPAWEGTQGAGGPGIASVAIRLHWIRTALIILLLADMIYKPGA